MANSEHLEILNKGVLAWNSWRIENAYNLTFIPDLRGADLSKKNLSGAQLNIVRLDHSNLRGSNLSGTNLQGANLNWTRLINTDLTGADLSHAFLSMAAFDGVKCACTNFFEVKMMYATINDVDLSEATNLKSVIHYGGSSVGLDTIYKSRGNIPEKFLRGCGVPEEFIVQIPALIAAMQPIQFYSCFISYSSKDDEFAKRLYADLQNEGVRCWFAPEDLKIGERFRVRIDESIRLYDKLLLVLSENSVSSEWVSDEVEAALEKEEGQKGKVVLFPLRLDDAVMEINVGWPAKVRRSRHIGDFRDWKNHDSYQKAFERLMRDLKAEASR